MILTRIFLILGLSLGFAVACDSDDDNDGGTDSADHGEDSTGETGDCVEISSKCHDNPENDPEISECHDIGHDGDETVCAAQVEHCLDLCEGHGSGDHDDSGTDGHDDSGTDGSDDGGTGTDSACGQLSEACEENPDMDPDIEACHEHGHDGDEATCEEHLEACLELCTHE